MWEEILKANPRNPHGIHVTKMYMFLKRYFADSHTDQFKKTYILWHEFGYRSDRERLHDMIFHLIDGTYSWNQRYSGKKDKAIPGIKINRFDVDDDEFDIEFNDAEHLKGRDEHISHSVESSKGQGDLDYQMARRVNTEAPHDYKLQRSWDRIQYLIKRSHNTNYTRTYRRA